ncbi:Uncharacterized protein OBRU01_15495 [Operophtera brumata]|uniref:Transmembrane protein n=1 Tax=Operophtera brumata TaxID=104452 RepID=A0A0L7L2Z6_OPEBR|nr:Uncharacterized protein OBRU01_15495 [Operophtera brumata]
MHAVGLHSALAIRRERKRRVEQQRARERRYSLQSSESGLTSPHCSSGSLERRRAPPSHHADNEVVSSVGMLHLGVVFLVLGLFLVGSGWLPDDVTSWSNVGSASWFNELVCSGLFALAIGAFLVALHKYLTKSEEDALEEYVQRQLTRSRSGHRLERDAETGGMQTRHARRARATEVGLPLPPAGGELALGARARFRQRSGTERRRAARRASRADRGGARAVRDALALRRALAQPEPGLQRHARAARGRPLHGSVAHVTVSRPRDTTL